MKKILQALDNPSPKSVEATNEMKKILSILNEGANPHKVSLPVQMAMQHYNAPAELVDTAIKSKPSLTKYINEVEDKIKQDRITQKSELNSLAKIIAERVLTKESYNPNMSPNPGFTGGVGPGLQSNEPTENIENPKDIIKMDVPLLIRLLEYAREDAKTDMDLHNVTERLIEFSKDGDVLSMEEYDAIVGEQKALPSPSDMNEECWKGYQQYGMKKKGSKQVPNCVPKKGK